MRISSLKQPKILTTTAWVNPIQCNIKKRAMYFCRILLVAIAREGSSSLSCLCAFRCVALRGSWPPWPHLATSSRFGSRSLRSVVNLLPYFLCTKTEAQGCGEAHSLCFPEPSCVLRSLTPSTKVRCLLIFVRTYLADFFMISKESHRGCVWHLQIATTVPLQIWITSVVIDDPRR